MKPLRRALPLLVSTVFAWPATSHAVRLADDGLGQALIYPYYTAQSASGESYNTYLSIVNHAADAKALRVRFREGRASKETLSFNVYLGPHDAWVAAIGPGYLDHLDGTILINSDDSCTSPALATPGEPFQNALFSGTRDDGNGTGLDRTREGYLEVIEMATLTGTSAAAVTPDNTGRPPNCAAVQGNATVQAAAPSGGLSGTLTLINVANGLNFDMNAVALADLSTKPFYRPPSDPYPDFNATEIEPVSLVVANGAAYRSDWSRPVDAVSAVLMRRTAEAEYVLDEGTASNTDIVATFPTRSFYVSASGTLTAPFSGAAGWAANCQATAATAIGTTIGIDYFNRASSHDFLGDFGGIDPPPPVPPGFRNLCASAVVFDVTNGSPHTMPAAGTLVLGSLNRALGAGSLQVPGNYADGWLRMNLAPNGSPTLTSLPSSTRLDLATGAVTTGPHVYSGLPLVGFAARTFVNGTLHCSAGSCQGNYGGALPLQYTRSISP